MEGFDVGLVCLNGHEINCFSERYPETNSSFCRECGKQTIDFCPKCKTKIRGSMVDSYGIGWEPPKYCHSCGTAYPWTESKIEAFKETIGLLDGLTDEEQRDLTNSIPDIISQTPKTNNAITRINRAIVKCGKNGGKMLYDVAVNVAANKIAELIKYGG